MFNYYLGMIFCELSDAHMRSDCHALHLLVNYCRSFRNVFLEREDKVTNCLCLSILEIASFYLFSFFKIGGFSQSRDGEQCNSSR